MGYEAVERDKIRAELADVAEALANHPSSKSYLLKEITIEDLINLTDVADVDLVLRFEQRKQEIPDSLPEWF